MDGLGGMSAPAHLRPPAATIPDAERESWGIVLLYSTSERLLKGESHDLLAEQGITLCAEAIADALEGSGHRVARVPIHTDLELALAPYPPTKWTVFNLGEGSEGRLFEEVRIAWALEAMGYRFTGAKGDAIARTTHKARAKEILRAEGIPTPAWWSFRHPDEIQGSGPGQMPFPLIVKPVAEDASIGVGRDAVVRSMEELRRRVAYVVERYRQTALVEAFIGGREFNVALWGDPPTVLPLAEIDFQAFQDPYDRIVSFSAKWETETEAYRNTPVICPAAVGPELAQTISLTAKKAWRALGCQGYARVDMRVSEADIPYVIEVNCNPDLSPDAGFYRAARAAGYGYAGMVAHILEIAREHRFAYDRIRE